MNGLPDWAIFVLLGASFLLADDGTIWRYFKFLFKKISKFIGKYI
jgi:hypothetical protein